MSVRTFTDMQMVRKCPHRGDEFPIPPCRGLKTAKALENSFRDRLRVTLDPYAELFQGPKKRMLKFSRNPRCKETR